LLPKIFKLGSKPVEREILCYRDKGNNCSSRVHEYVKATVSITQTTWPLREEEELFTHSHKKGGK
jgi:hypothetical protein